MQTYPTACEPILTSFADRQKSIAKYFQEEEGLICSDAKSVELQLALNATIKNPPYLCRVFHAVYDVLGAVVVGGAPVQVQLAQAVGAGERPPSQHCKDTASAPATTPTHAFPPRGPTTAPLRKPARRKEPATLASLRGWG